MISSAILASLSVLYSLNVMSAMRSGAPADSSASLFSFRRLHSLCVAPVTEYCLPPYLNLYSILPFGRLLNVPSAILILLFLV